MQNEPTLQTYHGMTVQEIVRLYDETVDAVWRGRSGRGHANPTIEDIKAVEDELSVHFPASVRYFLRESPHCFPQISRDFSEQGNIVWDNWFYRNHHGWTMPPELIMFSGGHDEDCICFDTRSLDEDGEYPIVYWDLESMVDIEDASVLAATFPEFLINKIERLMTRVK